MYPYSEISHGKRCAQSKPGEQLFQAGWMCDGVKYHIDTHTYTKTTGMVEKSEGELVGNHQ